MQVRPTEVQEGDTLLVMTRAVVRVLSVETPTDRQQIGARRVVIEVVGVWQGYDSIDLDPTLPIERLHTFTPKGTPDDAGGERAYL